MATTPTESTPKKYYLGLVFNDPLKHPIQALHVTHVYLGELTIQELLNVAQIVSDYFRFYGQPQIPRVTFNKVEMFGENKDIRVLTTDNLDAFKPIKTLRHIIHGAGYGKATPVFPFRPHVTTNAHEISAPFKAYDLVSKDEILTHWPVAELIHENAN